MKLLRDQKVFFYFRVTISLNNAWLWGGVARGLWSTEMHSWVKLYIIITAGAVASDGVSTATSSLCFLHFLFYIRAVEVLGYGAKDGQGVIWNLFKGEKKLFYDRV